MSMTYFSVIAGHLYKMGAYEIMQCYVPNFEQSNILDEAHEELQEDYAGKATTQKILHARLWWLTHHNFSKVYCMSCGACQRTGRSSWRDVLPLNLQMSLQPFEKWEIDFVGPIQPLGKKTGARYIITATEYLTKWEKVQPVKDCIGETIENLIFEYVMMRFGCSKILMSDHGTHFLNETISVLMEEFQVYHQKSTPYHLQANGTVEAFNKILDNAMTKVCNAQINDWDVHVPVVLWACIMTCKMLT